MITTLGKLRDLLDQRERRNAMLVVALMLVLGPLEAAGVASVVPVLAVLTQPDIVHNNRYLVALYDWFGFTSINSFLLFLASIVFVLVISRILLAALTQYAIARFSSGLGYSLSMRLLNGYLRQPYVWFLDRHSADMGKTILSEADEVINGNVVPALQLVASAISTLFIVAVLITVDPFIAVTVIAVLGTAYIAVYLGVRRYMRRIGRERFAANRERYQIASEVLTGIKEVKINGLEDAYLQRFKVPANLLARRKAAHKLVGQVPRSAFEAIAQGGLLISLMVLLRWSGDDVSKVVPMLGLYAFAGLRLLPALQEIYVTMNKFTFGRTALDEMSRNLALETPELRSVSRTDALPPLRKSIELRHVTYVYPRTRRPALKDLSLTIPARTTVGFVGATGAGKTTAVDVILGLLEPQKGEVLVDGVLIGPENVRLWQRRIGYVSQHIFLADDTVIANIAFGVAPQKVDWEAAERAARCAELHSFIVDELPEGYQTKIGERGVRLSGGQRQRLCIARALYRDPDVLVFDEATSALDTLTEKAVMNALHKLEHLKTILIIAHRLSTVRQCDCIFLFDRGRLKAAGTFEQLRAKDLTFREMALSG